MNIRFKWFNEDFWVLRVLNKTCYMSEVVRRPKILPKCLCLRSGEASLTCGGSQSQHFVSDRGRNWIGKVLPPILLLSLDWMCECDAKIQGHIRFQHCSFPNYALNVCRIINPHLFFLIAFCAIISSKTTCGLDSLSEHTVCVITRHLALRFWGWLVGKKGKLVWLGYSLCCGCRAGVWEDIRHSLGPSCGCSVAVARHRRLAGLK